MKQAATRDLFNYWNELRGARCAPERNEIDPNRIRDVLADSFMLEVDIAQGFPFRLAGTRVNALLNANQKGLSFLAPWRAEERRNVTGMLMSVADGARPVVVGAAATASEQSECVFELLFLPLRHFGKTHSRVLGLIKPATPPDWLGLLPIGPLSLRSMRIVKDPAPYEEERMVVGRPFVATQGDAAISMRPGRPTLRVIEGGR